jgi:membrane protein YdbS with pleckstrin-like domain
VFGISLLVVVLSNTLLGVLLALFSSSASTASSVCAVFFELVLASVWRMRRVSQTVSRSELYLTFDMSLDVP